MFGKGGGEVREGDSETVAVEELKGLQGETGGGRDVVGLEEGG